MNFLKIQSDPIGIGVLAPDFIWWAAGILLFLPLCVLVRLFWIVRKESKSLKGIASIVDRIRSRYPVVASQGVPAAGYDALSQLFEKIGPLRLGWTTFDSFVVRRRSSSGEEQCWVTESAAVAFSEALVFESRVNRGIYAAVPGIVTGAGLLFTFLAILVALL
jgi:hypothetical protein